MVLILVLVLLLSPTILHSVLKTNLLFAIGTLKFLFQPVVNAGHVKYVLARKWFYLSSCYEHLETDRAQNLVFSPLNLLSLLLSETFSQTYFRWGTWSKRLQSFATTVNLMTSFVCFTARIWLYFVFWNLFELFFNELKAGDRINDVPNLVRLRQRFSIRIMLNLLFLPINVNIFAFFQKLKIFEQLSVGLPHRHLIWEVVLICYTSLDKSWLSILLSDCKSWRVCYVLRYKCSSLLSIGFLIHSQSLFNIGLCLGCGPLSSRNTRLNTHTYLRIHMVKHAG